MRIVGIGGLWSRKNPLWVNLEAALAREFPGSTFVLEEEVYLRLYEIRRAARFAEAVLAKHDDGEDILLIGHSFGGRIACSIANRFVRSRIIGVVTIFSPNRWPAHLLVPCRHGQPRAPILSFGAWRDYVVPILITRHRRAVRHVRLWSNHWRDLVAKKSLADEIARTIKHVLFLGT